MLVSNRETNPIPHDDPLYMPKTVAWRVLQDAVGKSCLSNNLYSKRSKPSTSKEMVGYLSEARQWIMDMSEDAPGEEIDGGMIAGFGCGFCLRLLEVDRHSFIGYVRSLWREHNPAIKDVLTTKLRKEKQRVAAAAHRNKLRRKWGKRPLALPMAKHITHTTKALSTIRRSEEWHG